MDVVHPIFGGRILPVMQWGGKSFQPIFAT